MMVLKLVTDKDRCNSEIKVTKVILEVDFDQRERKLCNHLKMPLKFPLHTLGPILAIRKSNIAIFSKDCLFK